MAWDFSVEAGNREPIERKLWELWPGWELPAEEDRRLRTMFDEQGLSARFFDALGTALYAHRDLYVHEVLKALGFRAIFERRSKSANFGMNQLFHSYLEGEEATAASAAVFENCAFLGRSDILSLLDWLEICAALISGDNLLYYDAESATFQRADQCCKGREEEADLQAFASDWGRYRQLKWDIENGEFDLFYWYNSY